MAQPPIHLPHVKKYPSFGKCIYCGRTPSLRALTEEHIVPHGLGGRVSILGASCDTCQKIIHRVEEFCLRFQFLEPRTHLRIGRRHKKERRSDLRVLRHEATEFDNELPVLTDTNQRWDNIPLSRQPWSLVLPRFPALGGASTGTYEICGTDIYFPPDYHAKLAALGPNTMNMQPFRPDVFCRMLAKIAHSAAVATLGLNAFDALLPPYILGERDNLAHLVGNARNASTRSKSWSDVVIYEGEGEIIANLRIFARLMTTVYEVKVGRTA